MRPISFHGLATKTDNRVSPLPADNTAAITTTTTTTSPPTR